MKDDKSQLKFAPRCSEVHKLQVSAYSQGQLPCFPFKSILIKKKLIIIIIIKSDAQNSRSACLDWHNFIRACIKYYI